MAGVEIGALIADKYRLVRAIGSGGMGVVYEAQHEVTLRRVAVKLIHSWIADAASASGTRFLREARAPAAIEHPGIVEILDAGHLPDSSLYLVFELLEGEELAKLFARGGLEVRELVEIAIEVLDVLSAAHQSSFIHRDIKPANVFLQKKKHGERRVKVLDFGISKHTGTAGEYHQSVTAKGSVVGTLEYMAPEQARGEAIDARADLWSVGALMMHGLTGQPPFMALKDLELIDQVVRAPVPMLASRRPDLPDALCKVVDRALERNVAQRWSSAAQMRDALRACISAPVLVEPLPLRVAAVAEWEISDPDGIRTSPSKPELEVRVPLTPYPLAPAAPRPPMPSILPPPEPEPEPRAAPKLIAPTVVLLAGAALALAIFLYLALASR